MTSGNGYFIYKATPSSSNSEKVEISGQFSTKPNTPGKNVLVVGEDGNGDLIFQYSVFKHDDLRESEWLEVMGAVMSGSATSGAEGVTSGYLFDLVLTVTQTLEDGGEYSNKVQTLLSKTDFSSEGSISNKNNVTWNLSH